MSTSSSLLFEIGMGVVSFLTGAVIAFLTFIKKYSKEKQVGKVCNKFTRIHSSINEILTELRIKTNCSRTSLVQFHNGGNFLDGSSILKFSITHESCDLGTSSTIDHQQATLLTRFTDKLEYLHENDASIINCKDLKSSHFRNYMQSRDVVAFIMIPIYCEKKINIIGYISCEWCDDNLLNTLSDEGLRYIVKYSRNIITELLYKQKDN
jgi:hypothetical protein